MKPRFAPLFLALALAAVGASLARGSANYSYGPLPSHTGAPAMGTHPAELNCTQCHTDGGTPNLNVPGGSIEILDLPAYYAPGVTYRMRVRLSSDQTVGSVDRRWGFQLTAINAADGAGAGAFTVRGSGMGLPGDTLWILPGDPIEDWPSRSYVEHTWDGKMEGATGPVSWSFDWTAPGTGVGTVVFCAAGNAANGNGDPSSDWIYTTSVSMTDTTTAAATSSWGAIKSRRR